MKEVVNFVSMFIPRKVSLILAVLFLFQLHLMAQDVTLRDSSNQRIYEDPRISELVERYQRKQEIKGYRIQIISSSKKEQARKTKSEFMSLYQSYPAYEIYQQPFFIVKAGDFLTKLEAEKFHREIKEFFPESFVLPDEITPLNQYGGVDD